MDIEKALGRLSAGVAAMALLGLVVHVVAELPGRARSPIGAQPAAPAGPGEIAGVPVLPQGPAVSLTTAMVATAPTLPAPEFSGADVPVEAGESVDGELSALRTQVTNSLVPTFMNYAIQMPFSLASQFAHEVPSALDIATITPAPADAVPAF